MRPKEILVVGRECSVPSDVVLVYEKPEETSDTQAPLDILVLDRDGTANRDEGYVHGTGNLYIPTDIFESVPILARNSRIVGIASNQSGVGMGEFSGEDSIEFTNALVREIYEETGTLVSAATLCFHRPGGRVKELSRDCGWRKPNSGMLKFLLEYYDAGTGIMIGDSYDDVGAAHSIGWSGYKIDSNRENISMLDVLEEIKGDIEGFE